MKGLRGAFGAWGSDFGGAVDNVIYCNNLRIHPGVVAERRRRMVLIPGPCGAYTRQRRRRKSEMRAALESLLRAKKLDVTLTATPGALAPPPDRLAPTGSPELDAALGGGLRRGHLSEITGVPSSGRSTLAVDAIAAATDRGEAAALADPGGK